MSKEPQVSLGLAVVDCSPIISTKRAAAEFAGRSARRLGKALGIVALMAVPAAIGSALTSETVNANAKTVELETCTEWPEESFGNPMYVEITPESYGLYESDLHMVANTVAQARGVEHLTVGSLGVEDALCTTDDDRIMIRPEVVIDFWELEDSLSGAYASINVNNSSGSYFTPVSAQ